MEKDKILFHIALGLVFLIILFGFPTLVNSHGHSHDFEESPSFKYSRQANVEAQAQESHQGHSHDHHGHSHDHHGHSHDHHGHSHDHHGHSHGHDVPSSGQLYTREANELAEEARRVHEEFRKHQEEKTSGRSSEMTTSLWINALGSTLLVSAAPFFILFLIPLDNTESSQPLLKVLLSFAAGGLLGDAFLHLIPHALLAVAEQEGSNGGHGHSHGSHGHSHDGEGGHAHDLTVGLWVLAGMVAFLMVEKFVRIVKGGHGHSHGPVAAAPSVSKPQETEPEKESAKSKKKKKAKDSSEDEKENDGDAAEVESKGDGKSSEKDEKEKKVVAAKEKVVKKDEKKKEEKKKEEKAEPAPEPEIKVSGYLNLAADFTHNFTDGLAIGASYLAGHSIGVVTTITIILHEVPHEIGDFAILVQSGVPRRRAIFLQLSTAVGALTGTVVSLLAEGADSAATSRILPFTAGGFIYIATVSVIPELLEKTSLWQSVKELCAMFVGIYMMVLIAQYE